MQKLYISKEFSFKNSDPKAQLHEMFFDKNYTTVKSLRAIESTGLASRTGSTIQAGDTPMMNVLDFNSVFDDFIKLIFKSNDLLPKAIGKSVYRKTKVGIQSPAHDEFHQKNSSIISNELDKFDIQAGSGILSGLNEKRDFAILLFNKQNPNPISGLDHRSKVRIIKYYSKEAGPNANSQTFKSFKDYHEANGDSIQDLCQDLIKIILDEEKDPGV